MRSASMATAVPWDVGPPPADDALPPPSVEALLARYAAREATVAVVGLGHVGLPLAQATAAAGFPTIGLDTDGAKLARLVAGESPLPHLRRAAALRRQVASGALRITGDARLLGGADAVLICVPTPLGPDGAPDLRHVRDAADAAAAAPPRPGALVVLESTTWPGTTRGVVAPILEAAGLRVGRDVHLAYSPEREDPGNERFGTANTPKLVAGVDADALRLAEALYGAIVRRVVPVRSPEVAEAAKLAENVFRAVNIALANELKHSLDAMGLDAWEVIEAAATKPFGYMPFWPGPGPGGHCIPVDPVYLAWAARRHGAPAALVEAAVAVNAAAPRRVLDHLEAALGGFGALAERRVLVLGVGYKPNLADLRDSPALALMEGLEARGAAAAFHDPLVEEVPALPDHPGLSGRRGLGWAEAMARPWDAALIATDHDGVDYAALVRRMPLVVDTRNACARRGIRAENVVKA